MESDDTAQAKADSTLNLEEEESDGNTIFLRAARDGNLHDVLEYLKGSTDINTSNPVEPDIDISNVNGLNALHLASKEGHITIVTELLKRGANVEASTKKGNTALHIASLAGHEEIVKLLVESGAKVNVQAQMGFTPLYMAAQEGHAEVVKYLLANGANQSLATADGFTPLAVALQQGHELVVTCLLEHDTRGRVRLPALHIAAKKDDMKSAALLLQNEQNNVDNVTKSGFTPLHIAAHYGNINVGELLIQKGADVNYKAKNNITPLHVSARWGKANMVSLLLNNKAVIDEKTRDGLTPLHCAARSGHENVVDLLLERGAPFSSKTKNGLTPLHMAAQGDHVDCARLLLYYLAEVDEVTVDYLRPLHVAAHCGNVKTAKLLLDKQCDPNTRALNGFTPLHIACKKNRIKVVELLLKYGASIETTTESGLTPLHVASFMGHMNVVIYLIQNNANPDFTTVRGETALHLAARANQTDIIRILLRNGASVDARAREQQTPLHIAARLGNIDNVKLLLQHGASPDAVTKDLYTPLHIAAKEGHEEVASVLLEHGASHGLTTKKGFTPLHIAAKYGNIKVARLLLQQDANPDVQGKNGLTPLHVATHYNHVNVALLLLDNKASPHSTAKNGYTPLHIAAKKNQMDIATTLLEFGAKPDAESKNGFTPLHLASQEGHTDMVSLLLEHKANVTAKAHNGLTPMHLAAQEDKVNIAQVLVKYGSDTDPQTKAGYTPLHTACHFGQINMVRFLLEQGASVSATTKLGYTPLHQAAQQGHVQVVNLLLKNKASPNAVTNNGQTALSIAQRLGYLSVVDTLAAVTEVTETLPTTEDKYKVVSPETMQDTLLSDSEDEGGEDSISLGERGESTSPLDTSYEKDVAIRHPMNEDQRLRIKSEISSAMRYPSYLERAPDYEAEMRYYSGDTLSPHGRDKSAKSDSVFGGDYSTLDRLSVDKSRDSSLSRPDGKLRTTEESELEYGDDFDDAIKKDYMEAQLMSQSYSAYSAAPPDNRLLTGTSKMDSSRFSSYSGSSFNANYDPDNVAIDRTPTYSGKLKWKSFLISFMVDARGGAMRGRRHSGVRIIIPPRKASMPTRVTCRLIKRDKLMHPLPLNEGEALASRILEMGPVGTKFLGRIVIEIPHFASLRGKEREIKILRSDNGEKWEEHPIAATDDAVNKALNESLEDLEHEEDLSGKRLTRILTDDFPRYFALVTKVREEKQMVGEEGGVISSTVVPQVQAVFPDGALTKKIKVGLQAQPINPDLVAKLLGNRVAVSPIVTVEPRRRKFHKTITLTIPVPKAAQKGMINQYGGDTPTLRVLYSISEGTDTAVWDDLTDQTVLKLVNDCVSFTTRVSGRFWLMDCQNVADATRMATELYREAIIVPYMARFVVFAKRTGEQEGKLRMFCMTDDRIDKTLEKQEHFVEVARSRDVEVLEGRQQFVEMAGNLIPITKSGDQLYVDFKAFRENRLPCIVRIRDQDQEPAARVAFMKEPKVARGEVPQTPMCNLNIALPDMSTSSSMEMEGDAALELRKRSSLLKEHGIVLEDTVSRAQMRITDVADTLKGDWVILGQQLDISPEETNQIKRDYSTVNDQALAMLQLWVNKDREAATGNALEKALTKINREDVIKKCMYNVSTVEDEVEAAAARVAMDQSGFDTFTEEVGISRDSSMKRGMSLDVQFDEQDIVKGVRFKESESVTEEAVSDGGQAPQAKEEDTEQQDDQIFAEVDDRRAVAPDDKSKQKIEEDLLMDLISSMDQYSTFKEKQEQEQPQDIAEDRQSIHEDSFSHDRHEREKGVEEFLTKLEDVGQKSAPPKQTSQDEGTKTPPPSPVEKDQATEEERLAREAAVENLASRLSFSEPQEGEQTKQAEETEAASFGALCSQIATEQMRQQEVTEQQLAPQTQSSISAAPPGGYETKIIKDTETNVQYHKLEGSVQVTEPNMAQVVESLKEDLLVPEEGDQLEPLAEKEHSRKSSTSSTSSSSLSGSEPEHDEKGEPRPEQAEVIPELPLSDEAPSSDVSKKISEPVDSKTTEPPMDVHEEVKEMGQSFDEEAVSSRSSHSDSSGEQVLEHPPGEEEDDGFVEVTGKSSELVSDTIATDQTQKVSKVDVAEDEDVAVKERSRSQSYSSSSSEDESSETHQAQKDAKTDDKAAGDVQVAKEDFAMSPVEVGEVTGKVLKPEESTGDTEDVKSTSSSSSAVSEEKMPETSTKISTNDVEEALSGDKERTRSRSASSSSSLSDSGEGKSMIKQVERQERFEVVGERKLAEKVDLEGSVEEISGVKDEPRSRSSSSSSSSSSSDDGGDGKKISKEVERQERFEAVEERHSAERVLLESCLPAGEDLDADSKEGESFEEYQSEEGSSEFFSDNDLVISERKGLGSYEDDTVEEGSYTGSSEGLSGQESSSRSSYENVVTGSNKGDVVEDSERVSDQQSSSSSRSSSEGEITFEDKKVAPVDWKYPGEEVSGVDEGQTEQVFDSNLSDDELYYEETLPDGTVVKHRKVRKKSIHFADEKFEVIEREGPEREVEDVEDKDEILDDGTVHNFHRVRRHSIKHVRKTLLSEEGEKDIFEGDVEVPGTAKEDIIETFHQPARRVSEVENLDEVLEDGSTLRRKIITNMMVSKVLTRHKSFDDGGGAIVEDTEVDEVIPGTTSCFVQGDDSSSSSEYEEEEYEEEEEVEIDDDNSKVEADLGEIEEVLDDGTVVRKRIIKSHETTTFKTRSGELDEFDKTKEITEERVIPSPRSRSPVAGESLDVDQMAKDVIQRTIRAAHLEASRRGDEVETSYEVSEDTSKAPSGHVLKDSGETEWRELEDTGFAKRTIKKVTYDPNQPTVFGESESNEGADDTEADTYDGEIYYREGTAGDDLTLDAEQPASTMMPPPVPLQLGIVASESTRQYTSSYENMYDNVPLDPEKNRLSLDASELDIGDRFDTKQAETHLQPVEDHRQSSYEQLYETKPTEEEEMVDEGLDDEDIARTKEVEARHVEDDDDKLSSSSSEDAVLDDMVDDNEEKHDTSDDKTEETDVEEQFSPLPKHSPKPNLDLQFDTSKPTFSFTDTPPESLSPSLAEDEVSPVGETLTVSDMKAIAVGVSPSDFIPEQPGAEEEAERLEEDERRKELFNKEEYIFQQSQSDRAKKDLDEEENQDDERDDESFDIEDVALSASCEEGEQVHEKRSAFVFENYGFSDSVDTEKELCMASGKRTLEKSVSVDSKSGRDISPEDLEEKPHTFDFPDEMITKTTEIHTEYSTHEETYKRSYHREEIFEQQAFAYEAKQQESREQKQSHESTESTEETTVTHGEHQHYLPVPADTHGETSSEASSDGNNEVFDESTGRYVKLPWEVAHQFKRQFSDSFIDQEKKSSVISAESIDLGMFYRRDRDEESHYQNIAYTDETEHALPEAAPIRPVKTQKVRFAFSLEESTHYYQSEDDYIESTQSHHWQKTDEKTTEEIKQYEPHDDIADTHEQTVIASILESRRLNQEQHQITDTGMTYPEISEDIDKPALQSAYYKSAEVTVHEKRLSGISDTSSDAMTCSFTTAVTSLDSSIDRAMLDSQHYSDALSGEELFARDDVTTETQLTPVKESNVIDSEVVSVVSRESRLAQQELLQESCDDVDRSLSPSADRDILPTTYESQAELQDEESESTNTSKFPMALPTIGKALADNEIYESSETGGDTTEEKLSPIEETPQDEFPEEQVVEESVKPSQTEKRVTFQTDVHHLHSVSSEDLVKTSTSSSEMEPTLLAASYDLDSGRVSRVVTAYDMSPDSVEKQFPVQSTTKAILSSPEDDVFEAPPEENTDHLTVSDTSTSITITKVPSLEKSSSSTESCPSPPAPTPQNMASNAHETRSDLEGAAIRLQSEADVDESESDLIDSKESFTLEDGVSTEEVFGAEAASASKEDGIESPFEIMSPSELHGYDAYVEEMKTVEMMRSFESMTTSTSSFSEMRTSDYLSEQEQRQGMAISFEISPIEPSAPPMPEVKSESSFDHSSPLSSEPSEKGLGSPFDQVPTADQIPVSFSGEILPDLLQSSTISGDQQELHEKAEAIQLPNGPTEVEYNPDIDLDFPIGESIPHTVPESVDTERQVEVQPDIIQSTSPTLPVPETETKFEDQESVEPEEEKIEALGEQQDLPKDEMYESNTVVTEGMMEEINIPPGFDPLLSSDQTLYGLDMPSEETGAMSLSTSQLESSEKFDTELESDSIVGITSQIDEDTSEQSELKDSGLITEDQHDSGLSHTHETSEDLMDWQDQDEREKDIAVTKEVERQEEMYELRRDQIYPGKRALEMFEPTVEQELVNVESVTEETKVSDVGLDNAASLDNIQYQQEVYISEEVVHEQFMQEEYPEEEVYEQKIKDDEIGDDDETTDKNDDNLLLDLTIKQSDNKDPLVQSRELELLQLESKDIEEEGLSENFDLTVDIEDLERPITPTPVDAKQHFFDDDDEQFREFSPRQEEGETHEELEGTASEFVETVLNEAYARVSGDNESDVKDIGEADTSTDKYKEITNKEKTEDTVERSDDVQKGEKLVDQDEKEEESEEEFREIAYDKGTFELLTGFAVQPMLIKQVSEDIPSITITQHLHEEEDDNDIETVDIQPKQLEKVELEDEIVQSSSATFSETIPSEHQKQPMTSVCIPEEEEEEDGVLEEVLQKTSNISTMAMMRDQDRGDLVDSGKVCVPEEDDAMDDEEKYEDFVTKSSNRPLTVAYPGHSIDHTDTTKTTSTFTKETSYTTSTTVTSTSITENQEKYHQEQTFSPAMEELMSFERDIAQTRQLEESDNESLDDYLDKPEDEEEEPEPMDVTDSATVHSDIFLDKSDLEMATAVTTDVERQPHEGIAKAISESQSEDTVHTESEVHEEEQKETDEKDDLAESLEEIIKRASVCYEEGAIDFDEMSTETFGDRSGITHTEKLTQSFEIKQEIHQEQEFPLEESKPEKYHFEESLEEIIKKADLQMMELGTTVAKEQSQAKKDEKKFEESLEDIIRTADMDLMELEKECEKKEQSTRTKESSEYEHELQFDEPLDDEFKQSDGDISDSHDILLHDDVGDSSSVDSFTTVVPANEEEVADDDRMDDFASMTSSFHSDIMGMNPDDDIAKDLEGPLIDWGPQAEVQNKEDRDQIKPLIDFQSATSLEMCKSDEDKTPSTEQAPTKDHGPTSMPIVIKTGKPARAYDTDMRDWANKVKSKENWEHRYAGDLRYTGIKEEEEMEGPLIDWGREEEGSESCDSDRYEFIDKQALSVITELSEEDRFEMIEKGDLDSMSDRHYSSPDMPLASPGMGGFKLLSRSADRDDVSITSSLLEFEKLEREIGQSGSRSSLETADKDSLSSSVEDRHFMYVKSSERDDNVSVTSSLAEFERLERDIAVSGSSSSVEKITPPDSKSSDIDGSRSSLGDLEKLEKDDERRGSVESFTRRSETSSLASLNEFERLEQELAIAQELEAEAQKIVSILESGTLTTQQMMQTRTVMTSSKTTMVTSPLAKKDDEIDRDSIDGKDDLEDSLSEGKKYSKDETLEQAEVDSLDGDLSELTSMTSSVIMAHKEPCDADSLHETDGIMKISSDSLGEQLGIKPKEGDKFDTDSLQDQEGIMTRSGDSLELDKKSGEQFETDSLHSREDVMQTSSDSLQGPPDIMQTSITSQDSLHGQPDIMTTSIDSLSGADDIMQMSTDSFQGRDDIMQSSADSLQGREDIMQSSVDSLESMEMIHGKDSLLESSMWSVNSSNFSRSSVETMRSIGSRSDSSSVDIMRVSAESWESKGKKYIMDNYQSYRTTEKPNLIDYQNNMQSDLTSFHIDDNYQYPEYEEENATNKPFLNSGPYEEKKKIFTMAEWEAMKEEKRRASLAASQLEEEDEEEKESPTDQTESHFKKDPSTDTSYSNPIPIKSMRTSSQTITHHDTSSYLTESHMSSHDHSFSSSKTHVSSSSLAAKSGMAFTSSSMEATNRGVEEQEDMAAGSAQFPMKAQQTGPIYYEPGDEGQDSEEDEVLDFTMEHLGQKEGAMASEGAEEEEGTTRLYMQKQIHTKTVMKDGQEQTLITEESQIQQDNEPPEELREGLEKIIEQFMETGGETEQQTKSIEHDV